MVLVFPWVLYIGIPVVVILAFIKFKKKDEFNSGKKVANAGFVEETEFYKKLYKTYKIVTALVMASLLIAMTFCLGLISRPSEVQTIDPELRNRDIFLCMDISSSVDELNLDICGELKNLVKELDGERFGITIFNAKSILLVPLTTDYDYVLAELDRLEKSFEASLEMTEAYESMDTILNDDFDYAAYNYKYEGTLSEFGSSFIGDGLATCLFNFSDLEENKDRSRLIIFTTDNELNGTPHVTVDEAAKLCKDNDVKVFAIAPPNVVDEASFKASMESTGGGYYKTTDENVYKKVLNDIKKTETSVMTEIKTVFIDKPEILFVCLLVFSGMYFILSRKVKL